MKVFTIVVLLLGGLTAANVHAASRTLAWDYVLGNEASIDRYILQRKIVGGAYADLAVTLAPPLRIGTDATLTPGVAYCWQILAEKTGVGRSAASNEICATFRPRGRAPGRVQGR